MSEEFKVIETQEAFDAAIKSRLERNTRTVTEEVTKKFEGYVSPDEAKKTAERIEALTKEIEAGKATIADLTAKNSAYEISSVKMKIAQGLGIPVELAERLNGTTEEELKKAQEKIAELEKSSGKKAQIALEPFKTFYEAEEEHQDYYLKNPEAFEQELIESGRKKA